MTANKIEYCIICISLQIMELKPYMYIYCQNKGLGIEKVQEMMGPLLKRGELVKLDNKGREGEPVSYICMFLQTSLAKPLQGKGGGIFLACLFGSPLADPIAQATNIFIR